MRILLPLLCLTALAATAEPGYRPQTNARPELTSTLSQKLDPALYGRFKSMLDARFDPNHELKLSEREEAELRSFYGDYPDQLLRRYPHGLGDMAPIPGPSPQK